MSSFTFYEDIPQANDVISQSQPQILQNFQSIDNIWGIDHYSFESGTDGEHKQVTFPAVTSQSTPSNPESILYTKNDSATNPQLFFLNSQNSSYYTASANGSTVLMGGIILKWGIGASSTGGTANSFVSAFPNNCFSVVACNKDTSAHNTGYTISTNITGTSSFTAYSSVGTIDIYYIAIGN